MFNKGMMFVGYALIFKKGYRRAGFIIWMFVFAIVSVIYDIAIVDGRARYAASMDYQTMCANGEFEKAHLVKAKYYKAYSKELGKWRSGAWRDRQAREAQEIYQATASYIFAKEVVALYDRKKKDNTQKVIALLVSIPVDGAPLAKGEYGNGMFYNNDAAISSPTAIDHVVYQSWVQFFNNCCDKIFDLALANDDLELANKVCKLYKNEVATHFVADTIKGGNYNIAIVTYNDLRKNVAKQKIYEYNEEKILAITDPDISSVVTNRYMQLLVSAQEQLWEKANLLPSFYKSDVPVAAVIYYDSLFSCRMPFVPYNIK